MAGASVLNDAELLVLRAPHFIPHRPTALTVPGVHLDEVAEALFGRGHPYAPTAVLHVRLNQALLAAARDVAEVRLEQIMRTLRCEALVDGPALAVFDLIDRRLHVVVDAAAWDAA